MLCYQNLLHKKLIHDDPGKKFQYSTGNIANVMAMEAKNLDS